MSGLSTPRHLEGRPGVRGVQDRRAGGCVGVRACGGGGADLCTDTTHEVENRARAIEESPKIRNKPHRKVPRAMHNLT